MPEWPKDLTIWEEGPTGYLSIPFTWLLPKAQAYIDADWPLIDRWVVGGPAVELMPAYLKRATVGHEMPGVLQRVNPVATRTSLGCPRRCSWCAIGRGLIEPDRRELNDWPDGQIIVDNNLLATSRQHFGRVIDRLKTCPWCDLQGIDARLVSHWHARRLAELRRPVLRLALDCEDDAEYWTVAVERLKRAGLPKRAVRTYVLIGYNTGPHEAWGRCSHVESEGYRPSPLWFHRLNAMVRNEITPAQERLGWSRTERQRIMHYYYKHRGQKPAQVAG